MATTVLYVNILLLGLTYFEMFIFYVTSIRTDGETVVNIHSLIPFGRGLYDCYVNRYMIYVYNTNCNG